MVVLIKSLRETIKSAVATEKRGDDIRVTEALTFLGLLADRPAAERLLEQLTAAGVMAVDPRLTLLRLNAAL